MNEIKKLSAHYITYITALTIN